MYSVFMREYVSLLLSPACVHGRARVCVGLFPRSTPSGTQTDLLLYQRTLGDRLQGQRKISGRWQQQWQLAPSTPDHSRCGKWVLQITRKASVITLSPAGAPQRRVQPPRNVITTTQLMLLLLLLSSFGVVVVAIDPRRLAAMALVTFWRQL